MTEHQTELGEQLKAKGVQQVTDQNEQWMWSALTLIRLLAQNGEPFTSDDLRSLPPPHHPNAWGAVFNIAARQGLIERVGYRPSTTPSAHARVVAVWREKR